VVGIDSASRMLARIPPLPPGWEKIRGDAADLPFDDAQFDVVTAAYLLHLLDRRERDAVLAEARRVLRPGGRLVAVTVAPPRPAFDAIVGLLPGAAWRLLGPLAGLRPLDPREALESAGLRPVAARRVLRGYPSLVVVAEAPPPGEPFRPPPGQSS
jgi:ubiquinone/menaquinone biosynthesis C-methylase UbiE